MNHHVGKCYLIRVNHCAVYSLFPSFAKLRDLFDDVIQLTVRALLGYSVDSYCTFGWSYFPTPFLVFFWLNEREIVRFKEFIKSYF